MGGGASHVGLSAGPGRSVTAAAFRRALDVNTLGSFILSQAAAERMIGADADEEGERGVIINTSSIVALEGQLGTARSEEHTSELQSLMRISYAVFCLKKKKNQQCTQYIRASYRKTT